MLAQVRSTDIHGETPDVSTDPKASYKNLICLEWRSGNLIYNKMLGT